MFSAQNLQNIILTVDTIKLEHPVHARASIVLLLPRIYICVCVLRGSILISRRAKIIHCQ